MTPIRQVKYINTTYFRLKDQIVDRKSYQAYSLIQNVCSDICSHNLINFDGSDQQPLAPVFSGSVLCVCVCPHGGMHLRALSLPDS